ncbi:MAG: hypothetical protein KTR30_07590, partial [Saprospiraceae bacterium]|nr:hypothetical protein [Saprospiraceae bacterium]
MGYVSVGEMLARTRSLGLGSQSPVIPSTIDRKTMDPPGRLSLGGDVGENTQHRLGEAEPGHSIDYRPNKHGPDLSTRLRGGDVGENTQ